MPSLTHPHVQGFEAQPTGATLSSLFNGPLVGFSPSFKSTNRVETLPYTRIVRQPHECYPLNHRPGGCGLSPAANRLHRRDQQPVRFTPPSD
jgi:hypothetical protein